MCEFLKRTTKLGKYNKVEIKHYSEAELKDIAKTYGDEVIRGNTPLYVEDITVRSDLPPIIRGPYTATTAVAFELGWGGLFIKAHGQAMEYYSRHPSAGIANEFGVYEPPEAVHWDNELARKVGVPAAYDYGPERISWIGSLLTNWIGDAGFLEELNVQVRRHNVVGDLTTCHGKVVAVSGGPCGIVDLEVWAENQRGETTAQGKARVRLPSRAKGQSRPLVPSEAD